MTNPAGAAVPAPSSSTACFSATHRVEIVAAFLLAFATTCVVLHSVLSFPSVPDVGPRFRFFAEHREEFDTVFIGSSRIRHQIIPQEFDRETAAQGAATHSFNLGYSGMWPPESYYFLRQVLALHPQKLRWVFIELMDYRFGQAEGEPATLRAVYWHDPRHTAMAWRLVAESPLPALEKASLFATHGWQLLECMTNPGRGAEWLQQRYFPSKKKGDASWVARRGFDPEETGVWSESARAEYARKIQAFEQSQGQGHVRPGFANALQSMAADVRRAGAEPIFILPPTVRPEERLEQGLPPGIVVLAFDGPAKYARLYLPEMHFDPGHLNEAGAREFTSLVARRFAELSRAR